MSPFDRASTWFRHLRWARIGRHVWVFIGYVVCAAVLTSPVAFHLTTHIPIVHQIPGWAPGDGDPWHSLWVLWFANHSLFDLGRLSFTSDALFYPRGADLGYLSLIILPLLFSLPLVQLVGVVATHNLLILLSLASAGYASFLLVRYLTKDGRAAFAAGLIFAFCPYHMIRSLEHFFLVTSAPCLPLYILFLIKALRDGGTINAALAGVCLLLTVLSNPYYPVFLLLFTSLYVLFHLWEDRDVAAWRELIRRVTVVAAFATGLAFPFVAGALFREWQDIVLYTPLSDINLWGADLVAFFIPSPYHALWGSLVEPFYARFTSYVFEQTVYMGYVVLILAWVAMAKAPQRDTRFWALSALVFLVLALGPFLHINGRDVLRFGETTLYLPLPYLLLHFVPVLKGARGASRFDVMLMLSLAVLAGYGVKWLLESLERRGWQPRAVVAFLVMLAAAILLDFLSLPFPLLSAKIPTVYEEVGRGERQPRSLLEVPLDMGIAKYQYYQTAHGQRLLTGFGPRPPLSLRAFGDTFPFMKVFKEPERLVERDPPWDRRDAQRLLDVFDVDVIVLHPEYLKPATAERLQQLLLQIFPVERIVEDGSLSAFWMRRDHDPQAHWDSVSYSWEFDASEASFMLFDGWLPPERSENFTFAWASGKASQLWAFLPERRNLTLELRLYPLTIPEGPPQQMKTYVNERFLSVIELEANGWHRYVLQVPHTYLTTGLNTFRFVYRYEASPARVFPGSTDHRSLAVAFDFIALRPE